MIRYLAYILNLTVKVILVALGASTLKSANSLLDLTVITPY